MAEKVNEQVGDSGLLDPFKERLLNPFIFSLVIAFIARFRVELYDLFVGSTTESQEALTRLTIWDWHLLANLIMVIAVYLASIGLGSLVSAAKEYVKRKSEDRLKQVIPVSIEDYDLATNDNAKLREDLLQEKILLKNSSEHFANLLITTIKNNNETLKQLELIMPHYRGDDKVPFAYSLNHETKYSYGVFELPSDRFCICMPILRSGGGHCICVKFNVHEQTFRYNPDQNRQESKVFIDIPVSFINALEYQRWAEPHYFDEGSRSWTTTLPVRKRILLVHFDQGRKMLRLTVTKHPNFESAQALQNLLGI